MSERKGRFIRTSRGAKFWPMDPRASEVFIEDIANGLGNVCRFTGQCSRFYSVAEHSLIVSAALPDEYALAGLLHDASEAYIADVSSPVKHDPAMAEYRRIEARIQETIHEAFGLRVDDACRSAIHAVDRMALETEGLSLFPSWESSIPSLAGAVVVCYTPREAAQAFLREFNVLTGRV